VCGAGQARQYGTPLHRGASQIKGNDRLHCSHCGTLNEAGAYSCSRCGERIYAPDADHPSPLGLVACPKCSASNESQARYCWSCGASLESAVRVSPQGAATARAARPEPLTGQRVRPAPPPPPPPPRASTEAPRDVRSTFSKENDSGTRDGALPEELRGWNWGAFLLDFAWGVGNRVWWAAAVIAVWLVVFLTPIPAPLKFAILVGVKVLLGFKGNEWMWRSRQWESPEQFKLVQHMWMNWGVILTIIFVILWVVTTRTVPGTDLPTS